MKFTFSDSIKILKPIKVFRRQFFSPPSGFSIDSRTIKKGEAFFALKGKFQDGHNFIKEAVGQGATLIISEKILPFFKSLNCCIFLVKSTYQALENTLSYLRRKINPQVIAITGSVGKSTTKEMLELLKTEKTENNLLGISKTFFNLKREKLVVAELGTNSKGEIKKLTKIISPDIGIITFIKPVHLQGFKNLKEIFKEKISLIKNSSLKYALLNREDRWLRKVNLKKQIFWFGFSKKAHLYGKFFRRTTTSSEFLINDRYPLRLLTPFPFYIFNALASLLCATVLGIKLEEAVRRLSSFRRFLPQRMQKIKKKGVIFVNDSYNSNPFSLKEALQSLNFYSLPKIAILGDMWELGRRSSYYHSLLAKPIIKSNFDYVLSLGNFSLYLNNRLKNLGYPRAYHFNSHQEIAEFLRKIAKRRKYLVFVKGSRIMRMEKVIEYF
ncbi:MAG: hypothetical protein B6D56_02960 [Candidatus Omnitrophica bacterium 4484_70.1]|nr:MAG: hypothetical protein B6D56_02960 [Candidatus Omnitrophica bacterium 4484_70.1]